MEGQTMDIGEPVRIIEVEPNWEEEVIPLEPETVPEQLPEREAPSREEELVPAGVE